jgi:hypothetical protein
MNTATLSQLRDVLAFSHVQLKNCERAYKGFRAFKDSRPGLEFCAAHLHEAAAALREYVEQLAALAENLHDAYSAMPQQLELDDISVSGPR